MSSRNANHSEMPAPADPPVAAKLTALSPAERKRFAKDVVVSDRYVDYTR
jgi:hypothetical protein